MNHPQVWTTINKSAIDLSLFRRTWLNQQAGPSTRDFLVIILRPTGDTSPNHPWKSCGPKEMAHTHADWDLYRDHMMASTANMEWADVETNEANITRAILEAAELAIPKSSGKTSAAPYWRTTWESGWPRTATTPN